MIRSEAEYQDALRQRARNLDTEVSQRAALVTAGLPPEAIEQSMAPLLAAHAPLAADIDWYEAARRGEVPEIRDLSQVGRVLIALRLAAGLSQRALADRLGVSKTTLSRDEADEYRRISVDRAQRIVEALGATPSLTVRLTTDALP